MSDKWSSSVAPVAGIVVVDDEVLWVAGIDVDVDVDVDVDADIDVDGDSMVVL